MNAQIRYTLENDTTGFTTAGNWQPISIQGCHGGSAQVTPKGDGSGWAKWEIRLEYPGSYQVETYCFDYQFGKDTRWTTHSVNGDTTVTCDMYYEEGWQTLGTFSLPETTYVFVSNYFESDSGDYVLADAIRLTGMMDTYTLQSDVVLDGINNRADAEVKLYPSGSSQLLQEVLTSYQQRHITFENIPEGWYRMECVAWGYDTLIVDSVHIEGADLIHPDLHLTPTSSPTYQISGQVQFDNQNDTARCRVEIYPLNQPLLAGFDSVGHGDSYELPTLPTGNYRLIFKADHYVQDNETYSNITLNSSDLSLDPVTLYYYFQFAWCTDSHVGLSFTTSYFRDVIENINTISDQLDFVIHTGDITENGLNSELTTARNYANLCDLPVYFVPGNHDTKWSESGLQKYIDLFGELNYSFDHEGYHFVGLNNGVPMRGGGGYFDPVTVEWLKLDLAAMPDPNTPVIAYYHIPSDPGGVSNYWEALDILKQYRTVFIMVGHGHSNRSYDFEGLPGAMSMDTYRTSAPSGFNIVRVSSKDITITPYYSDSGIGNRWFEHSCADTAQPGVEFTNLETDELITESKTLQLHVEIAASSATYSIKNDNLSGSLSGSGQDWSCDLDIDNLAPGYHTLTVSFNTSSGQLTRTRGFYVEKGTYPRAKWRYQAGASIVGKPAVDSSHVYIGTSKGEIHAINRDDGTQAWSPIQTGGTIFSSPTFADGILYIGSSDGKLYALSMADGSIVWTFEAGSAILNGIVVRDSIVYFAANKTMYAVNINTQSKMWQYSAGGLIECQPAVRGDKIIFGSWDTQVHCLNRLTGNALWKWNHQSSFYYSPAACWPVVTADKVFVCDPARFTNALDLSGGALVWQSDQPNAWESIGINRKKEQVYIRSLDGNLYAFSATADDQQQLWQSTVGYGWDSSPSMPIGLLGTVFSSGKKGFVVANDQTDGTTHWKYWVSQCIVNTVTPLDGATVVAAALDGSVTYIEGDPSLRIDEPELNTVPYKNRLYPAYPNPFNNTITITYSLKKAQKITLSIYDLQGREVWQQQFDPARNGVFEYNWIGNNYQGQPLATGMYILRLTGTGFQQSRKILFLK